MDNIDSSEKEVVEVVEVVEAVDAKGIPLPEELVQKKPEEVRETAEGAEAEVAEGAETSVTTTATEDDNSDVFVTENDTFDIRVSYYKADGDLCIEGIDDEFDPKSPLVKHIDITFKQPCQGDYEAIIAQNAYKSPDKMTMIDVMQMELTRIVVLIRKWSLKAEFTRMVELDPKIVKSIANKVREKIGIKGIL